jgi:hypothetical protein
MTNIYSTVCVLKQEKFLFKMFLVNMMTCYCLSSLHTEVYYEEVTFVFPMHF